MKDLLIDTVEGIGYEIYLQGSFMENDTYPEEFFTFWNVSTDSLSFYDNSENAYNWDFELNYYSTNPEDVDTVLWDVVQELKTVGFINVGKGHDVASDEPTHTGRGIRIFYREEK